MVELVAVERSHLPVFLAWMNDAAISGVLADGPVTPVTLDEEEEWLKNVRAGRHGYVFSVLTLHDRRLVGNCSLKDVDWHNRRASLGMVIGDPADRGHGLGRDAIGVLLRFGFQELGLNRVELAAGADNETAVNCYRASGFIEEGRRREFKLRGDKYEDEMIMSILRREWVTGSRAVQG